jgi:hypothetical protein
MNSKDYPGGSVPLYLCLNHPDLNEHYLVVHHVVATNTNNTFAVPSKRLANLIKGQSNLIGLVLQLKFSRFHPNLLSIEELTVLKGFGKEDFRR